MAPAAEALGADRPVRYTTLGNTGLKLAAEEPESGIRLALDYDTASVCILPYYLKRCAGLLQGSDVRASTTIGFPHGGTPQPSTGYGTGGATLEDLALMRKHAAPHVGVKAAGGVRDLDALLRVRALGVTRCGATRTASMLEEARKRLGMLPVRSSAAAANPAGY